MAEVSRDEYEFDISACRARQARLIRYMQASAIDLVVVTRLENVQWLAGPRFRWFFSACAALTVDGHLTLIAPDKPEDAAADDIVVYESKRLSTLRNDQAAAAASALKQALGGMSRAARVGVEGSVCGPVYTSWLGNETVDVEAEFYRLRRHKDATEVALIKKAIAATRAMYSRAREIIKPGLSELHLFNELQAVAVEELGEMLTGTGNDYAVGARGGPPIGGRAAKAGELWILDLGPAFRGYFADNCRTFSVDRKPSAAQRAAWEQIAQVFPMVEQAVKPGASCKALFDEAKAMLTNSRSWLFNHHLGHGIGLFPHEGPHLNPNWDDTFEAGDVVAVEPGLYGPDLNAGIRLENNYLVTETGVELLSPFPLEL